MQHFTLTQVKKLVYANLAEWTDKLGLKNWKLAVGFNKELDAAATTSSDPVYQEATITFNQKYMAEMYCEREIEECVVHELTHAQLSPIADSKRRTTHATERTVVNISRSYLRLKYLTS